jgi:hypothetical protein
MSNSIYDILKKMAGLENPQPKKSMIAESKESKMCNECGMWESKCKCDHSDDKKSEKKKDNGAIAEAVARVEKQLTEKYKDMEESGLQAYLGNKKYGKKGMDALRKAGRDGASKEKMANIRSKYDQMDEDMSNEDMLSPKQKKIAKMSPPPNKIDAGDFAKLRAGKKGMKDEGNEFSGALAQAKAQHKDSFEVDGKTYPVKEGFEDLEKYMKEKEGKTTHGKKTKTKTGLKHERDYDKEDNEKETGEDKKGRGRPKKDKFEKKDKK